MKGFFAVLLVFIFSAVFFSCSPTAATFGGWQYDKGKGLTVQAIGSPSPSQLKQLFRIKTQDDLVVLLREGKITQEDYLAGLKMLTEMSDGKRELVLELKGDASRYYYNVTNRVMGKVIDQW